MGLILRFFARPYPLGGRIDVANDRLAALSDMDVLRSSHPAVSAFPEIAVGSACTSSFSRSHEAMVATGDLAE
jgi:hypothetical protein